MLWEQAATQLEALVGVLCHYGKRNKAVPVKFLRC
jgi:hypothetical protein